MKFSIFGYNVTIRSFRKKGITKPQFTSGAFKPNPSHEMFLLKNYTKEQLIALEASTFGCPYNKCKDENGEIDHKILAVLPGQDVTLGPELLEELQEFIYAIFAKYPDVEVRVGPILSRDAALDYLQQSGYI